MLKKLFETEKIEYFSSLSYGDVEVIREDIIAREAFAPRSVIVYLVPYYAGKTVNLSKYAAARDYHLYIRDLNQRLISELKKTYPENSFKGYGDSSPVDERLAALSAGLGILGDNRLLINEKYGSYVFIGEIITDVEPELLGAVAPSPIMRCRGCGICKSSCPTAHLENRLCECLSNITQRKGELTEKEIEIMRKCRTVWGCDVCQDVCPYNKNPIETPISFFKENRIEELTEDIVNSMSKQDFSERAFAWRGIKTLKRNLDYMN